MKSPCFKSTSSHIPVLKKEVVHFLRIRPDGAYLDGTIGRGGHASAIKSHLSEKGILLGLDIDEEAIEYCRALFTASSNIRLFSGSYHNFSDHLLPLGLEEVDGIFLDLGLSSHHIDSPNRGFSYRTEGPLDMRFDLSSPLTAEEIVNRWSEGKLKKILRELGEERQAPRIARAIVQRREEKPMATTGDLRKAVVSVAGGRYETKTLSRVFQALRIAVNGELDVLDEFLNTFVNHLRDRGRIVIISYHSLEDRLVKNRFRELEKGCICPPHLPQCVCGRSSTLKIVTRRPVRPDEAEIERNRRARSARLRAAERVA